MERYHDLPADFADATLVSLADDLSVYRILTLDRRGFTVYRGAGGEAFEIRP
jgi:predicted nucleic acid-binding protein